VTHVGATPDCTGSGRGSDLEYDVVYSLLGVYPVIGEICRRPPLCVVTAGVWVGEWFLYAAVSGSWTVQSAIELQFRDRRHAAVDSRR